jgi:hypothetical protein
MKRRASRAVIPGANSRASDILLRRPEGPAEHVRETLAAVVVVSHPRRLIAPVLPSEGVANGSAIGALEKEVVDLVRVFMLNDSPGVFLAERVLANDVQDDQALAGSGTTAARDLDGDLRRGRCRSRSGWHRGRRGLSPSLRGPALDDVIPAGGLSGTGESERGE